MKNFFAASITTTAVLAIALAPSYLPDLPFSSADAPARPALRAEEPHASRGPRSEPGHSAWEEERAPTRSEPTAGEEPGGSPTATLAAPAGVASAPGASTLRLPEVAGAKLDGECGEYEGALTLSLPDEESPVARVFVGQHRRGLALCFEVDPGSRAVGVALASGAVLTSPRQGEEWIHLDVSTDEEAQREGGSIAIGDGASARVGEGEDGVAQIEILVEGGVIAPLLAGGLFGLGLEIDHEEGDSSWPAGLDSARGVGLQRVALDPVAGRDSRAAGTNGTWCQDLDKDTFGNPSVVWTGDQPPAGYVANCSDCNDSSAATYPGANEVCNGRDDNCNLVVDENQIWKYYYPDADKDLYGDSKATATYACSKPSGKVENKTDCNDTNSAIYPGAAETCNGKDDDCDGAVDEGVIKTWYIDQDADKYGVSNTYNKVACTQPAGYAGSSGDCNDADKTIYPGATEKCDNKDNDCDSSVSDENAACSWKITTSGSILLVDYDSTSANESMYCTFPTSVTLSPTVTSYNFTVNCCVDTEVNMSAPMTMTLNKSTGGVSVAWKPRVYEYDECTTDPDELSGSCSWSTTVNAGSSATLSNATCGQTDEGYAKFNLTYKSTKITSP